MTLEQALTVARQDAHVVARVGGTYKPEAVLALLDTLVRAAHPFLAMLSESDAMVRSGRKVDYFRSRFAAWEAQGYAEKRPTGRYYRAFVVPQREQRAA